MPESFLKDKSVPARWRVLGVINGFILNGGCFYGSNEWLMEQLDCSEQTVSNAFAELERLGEIRTERTKRTRKVYKTSRDPKQLGSETQVGSTRDPSWFGSNSVSNSVSNSNCESEDSPVEIVSESSLEKEPKQDTRRTKDKLEIYHLFSDKEQPWWRHAQQRKAALSLFDLIGTDKVRAGLAFCKANEDNPYCPQPMTPYEYEQALPRITRFRRKNDL